MLNGDDLNSIRRRNALANALTTVAPPREKRTISGVVRTALYAIAPAYLWQFYSGQGLSGSNKTSFVDALPNIYKAVLVAVVQVTKVDQPTVTKSISEVLKTLHTRQESISFRERNPQEVKKHLGQSGDFSKKNKSALSFDLDSQTIDLDISDTFTDAQNLRDDDDILF